MSAIGGAAAEQITLTAADGRVIGAKRYGAGEPVGVVVIAGALSVPQRFYASFAHAVSAAGLTAVTFDYRGVGGSASADVKTDPATLSDWGAKDLDAALEYALGMALPTLVVAHSMGGQLLGLASRAAAVRAALFVAAQSGWVGNWSGLGRLANEALWRLAAPALVGAFGYLPMRRLWGGENVPRGVATEWRQWCLRPGAAAVAPGARHHGLRFPVRALSFSDDGLAPEAAVDALLRMFSASATEHVHHPTAGLGHFGFFKEAVGGTLWPAQLQWLRGHTE